MGDFLRRRIHPSYQWRVLDRHGGQGTYIGGRLGANCTRACALSPSKYAYLHATSYIIGLHILVDHQLASCNRPYFSLTVKSQVYSSMRMRMENFNETALPSTNQSLSNWLPCTSICSTMLLQSLPCTFLEKRSSTYEFIIHACVVTYLPLPILFYSLFVSTPNYLIIVVVT